MVSGSEKLIIMDKLLEVRPEQVWELETPGGLGPRGLPHLGDFYLQELCQELFIATSKEKSPHVCSPGRKIYFSEIYHNILSSTRPTLRRNYFPEPNLPGEGKCHNSGPPPTILSQPQGKEEEPERNWWSSWSRSTGSPVPQSQDTTEYSPSPSVSAWTP